MEVKPSFCLLWIKEAFERQRVFLFHGGPSKLQAMLVPGCVVGRGDRSVDTGRRQSYLLQGEKYGTVMGVGRRTAYHLSVKKKKKSGGERVRQGYRKRQMEKGGVESETDREGKREKKRREGALWGT